MVVVAVWRLCGGVGCAEGLLVLVCMCAELVCICAELGCEVTRLCPLCACRVSWSTARR